VALGEIDGLIFPETEIAPLAEAQLHNENRRHESQRYGVGRDKRDASKKTAVSEPKRNAAGQGSLGCERNGPRVAGSDDPNGLRNPTQGGQSGRRHADGFGNE